MRSAGWLVFGSVLIGCHNGSSAGGNLDRGTKFDDVRADQADELCDQAHALRDDVYLARLCTTLGVTLASIEGGTCPEKREACLKDPPALCFLEGALDDSEVECPDATVGMFLDCMAGGVRATKEAYANITCDTPPAEVSGLLVGNFDMQTLSPPPECAQFQKFCPAFFERE